jgi:cytochrome c-type biogenesis protein CcmH/NrfG
MMAAQSWFWFLAGLLSGVATAIVLLPLWRSLAQNLSRPALRYGLSVSVIVLVGAFVVALYRTVGRPDVVGGRPEVPSAVHAGVSDPAPGQQTESIEQAAEKLAQRLGQNGGSRDEWQLLAQSYEFLGRKDDAARAQVRAANAPATAATTTGKIVEQPEVSIADLERRVAANARDVDSWLGLAKLKRQQHDYAGARDAFARVITLKAMTADAWADYADVLGSLAKGSLSGAPARAIDNALALDPRHPKALWLKASLAHEEHRYAAAVDLWKQLRATMPADSPDIRIIDSNIAEAAELAGMPAAQPAAVAPTAAFGLSGTVSIDEKLARRVTPGDLLFIYAKAADSPGPPLAVMRIAAGRWPVSFRLDDSMAMIPSRRLSSFDRVIVEARISKSGLATPSPGDLFVVSPVLRPADGKVLKLVISQEVS